MPDLVTHRCSTTDPEDTQRPVDRFAAATPRPWSITRVQVDHFTFQLHLDFPNGSGVPIGALRDADAALIVAAVNAYDELIETLTHFVRIYEWDHDHGDDARREYDSSARDTRALLRRLNLTTERRPVSQVTLSNTDAISNNTTTLRPETTKNQDTSAPTREPEDPRHAG